jgi:hypothetical protein
MSAEIKLEGCLNQVFNFKLGHFAKMKSSFVKGMQPLLEL